LDIFWGIKTPLRRCSNDRRRETEKGYAPLSSAIENPYDDYQAFLNASWEIDLWGKLRRATEAARADLLSTEESRQRVAAGSWRQTACWAERQI
jgi:outer membrane protein TolC